MSDDAIVVEGLGKRYRLGAARYHTLRDRIAGLLGGGAGEPPRELWALRDVSFAIPRGEVVGIIGRNGAGKSTLLKLLSRIAEPTAGSIALRGRVGSLLEIGTGFHPELTGRENIYLNGALIGMSRAEVRAHLDEIVAFSGIEPFLDTPVKAFSSGMYMRLAFAVAAHLDCEILLADEVLAVGDAEFQKRCLSKMSDTVKSGRTVLLVSHNTAAISAICRHALWLDKGRLARSGPAPQVLAEYLGSLERESTDLAATLAALPPDPALRITGIAVRQAGATTATIGNGQPVSVEIAYEVAERAVGLRVYVDLLDQHENLLFRSFNDGDADIVPVVEPGPYVAVATVPPDLLSPTRYTLVVHGTIFNVRQCTPPEGIRIPLEVAGTSRVNRAYLGEPIRGLLAPRLEWNTSRGTAR